MAHNGLLLFGGGVNGLYQIISFLTKPIRDRMVNYLQLNRNTFGHKVLQIFITFCLIDFTWVFFRAKSLVDGVAIIRSMLLVHNPWIFFDESLFKCGLDRKNFYIMLIAILILMIADIFKFRGIKIRKKILEQDWWFRWLICITSIVLISIVGIWGSGYDQSGFIYFQF
ncbi:hypothetical protein IMSAG249_00495 [Lachnospiraceae bacterium]|nr:hypothetical protein IMSAG249_00495 [Lachnospiraceae bacterium]